MSESSQSGHGNSALALGLDFLTLLLTDVVRLRSWLRTCDIAVRRPFTKATVIIGGLRAATGLATEDLLDELRCRHREAQQLEDLSPTQLDHCVDFLGWVLALVLAAPEDRVLARGIVRSASAMYVDAGRDLEVCERAFSQAAALGDRTTPLDLLEMGEAVPAFQIARAALPGRAGIRAARWRQRHTGERSAHIGQDALEMLLRYSNGLDVGGELGVDRAVALLRHIGRCTHCELAYRAQARSLELEPADPAAVNRA